MDPMDFTMDDGQGSQQQNSAANQYHCQSSLPYSYRPNGNQSSRGMAVRGEGQPYDPVHDNSGPAWYHGGPNISNNSQAHNSYPHSEHTFGGTFHNQYHSIHENPHMRALAYQYMGGHEGNSGGGSPWMGAGHHNQYSHTPYYAYPSSMMNPNSDPNGQNQPVSQVPIALPTPNPHLVAQRQEYQAARVDQENIRNRVNAQFSSVPVPVPTHQEQPRLQQQPRVQQRPVSQGAMGAANYYAVPPNRPTFHDRSETTSLRNERTLAAHHRATLAAGTAVMARPRGLRVSAGYSDDDDEDGDDSPGNSPRERYRHSDHYLFAAERQDERMMATVREAMSQALSAADRDKKKVPSKDALESLVKLTVDEVKTQKKELYCIICYNDFGEANPEGTVEFPLMLPKCKHVFGNLCIKQWFTSNDSCPYCRDILPSESSSRRSAAVEQYRILQERDNNNVHSRLALARARSTLAYRNHAADVSASFAPAMENNMGQRATESSFVHPSRSFTNESPDRRRAIRVRPNVRPNQPVFSRSIPRVVSGTGAPMTTSHPSFTGGSYGAIPRGPINALSSAPVSQVSPTAGHGVVSEEAASPAVAVGSFVSTGERMPEQSIFAGNDTFSGFPPENNQPRHNLSNAQIPSTTTRSPVNNGSAHQENTHSPMSGNSSRADQNVIPAGMPPASNLATAPVTPQAERSQAPGNPASLPPNFRPRWTR